MYAHLGDGPSLSVANQNPPSLTFHFPGWGNSILALICLVVGCPAPFVFYRYGAKLRAHSKGSSVEQ
jgi:hypothetical protein